MTITILDFFKKAQRPLYYKTKMNQLRVGEILSLGGLKQDEGYAQAYIRKEPRKTWSFHALWTMPGKAIWAEGSFSVKNKMVILTPGTADENLTYFFVVCHRLADLIAQEREKYTDDDDAIQTSWYQRQGVDALFDGQVICRLGKTSCNYYHQKLLLSTASKQAISMNPLLALGVEC